MLMKNKIHIKSISGESAVKAKLEIILTTG